LGLNTAGWMHYSRCKLTRPCLGQVLPVGIPFRPLAAARRRRMYEAQRGRVRQRQPAAKQS